MPDRAASLSYIGVKKVQTPLHDAEETSATIDEIESRRHS